MDRFTIGGVVIGDVQIKTFDRTKAISKRLKILVTKDSKKPVSHKYDVEFNGIYANQIPNDIDLKGAEVLIVGSMTSIESKNGDSIVYLKGERLMIISYPAFEETDDYTSNAVAYVNPTTDADDDLPF